MSRSFGKVRNVQRGLPGYALASGSESRIAEIQTEIDKKTSAQATTQAALNKVISDLKIEGDRFNNICKPTWSKNKCNATRQPILSKINSLEVQAANLQATLRGISSDITSLTSELKTLLESKAKEAEANLVLAGQGKTAEQIKIDANAQAQAMLQESYAKTAAKSGNRKTVQTIVIVVVIAVVLISAVLVIKRIRNKKNANK